MDRIDQMLRTHPHPAGTSRDVVRACITACLECATVCTTCADACLAEASVQDLTGCIRLNLDCADLCQLTARLLARPSHRDRPTLRSQVQACAAACRACGDECARHGQHMETCRICAEACQACAEACERMAGALVA